MDDLFYVAREFGNVPLYVDEVRNNFHLIKPLLFGAGLSALTVVGVKVLNYLFRDSQEDGCELRPLGSCPSQLEEPDWSKALDF